MAVVRDRLFAEKFGAEIVLDIYYAAFRIPDIIFVAIASFVAITVVMPFFIENLNKNKEKAREFINSIFTLFFFAITLVSVVTYFATPALVEKFFSGFDATAKAEVISLTRVLLLSPILLGISNIFASITQAFRNFFVYALSPVLYNIGIIIGLLFFYPIQGIGITGLAYGVILGAVLFAFLNKILNDKGGFLRKKATLNDHLSHEKLEKFGDILKRISKSDIFKQLPPKEIQGLLPYMREVKFKADTEIFNKLSDRTVFIDHIVGVQATMATWFVSWIIIRLDRIR